MSKVSEKPAATHHNCPQCKTLLREDANFCTECGKRVGFSLEHATRRKKGKVHKIPSWLTVGSYFTLIYTGYFIVPAWFLYQAKSLNQLNTKIQLSRIAYQICLIATFINLGLLFSLDENSFSSPSTYDLILGVLVISLFLILCFYIYHFFKVRRMLIDHMKNEFGIKAHISKLLTFFFGYVYLQLRINAYDT